MRAITLANNLAIGSDLGALLRIEGIGLQSILRLKDAGVVSMSDLRACDGRKLDAAGLGKRQVDVLSRWLRRGRR